MAFADISLEEALVLEAYEEETLLAFELLDKSKEPQRFLTPGVLNVNFGKLVY